MAVASMAGPVASGDGGMLKEGKVGLGGLTEWLAERGVRASAVHRNLSAGELYAAALRRTAEARVVSTGALAVRSGAKMGRSPRDKRIVWDGDEVWWGRVNMRMGDEAYAAVRAHASAFLQDTEVYVVDAWAGWSAARSRRVRVVTTRPYHALFMQNMLIRPEEYSEHVAPCGCARDGAEGLNAADLPPCACPFEPELVIWNAGESVLPEGVGGISSGTCVVLNLKTSEMVIVGTEYAGEMKKGVLTYMMWAMPREGALPLHSSCNAEAAISKVEEGGATGRAALSPIGSAASTPAARGADVTLFFGLSGTGKTTLSADAGRALVGDDEHVWTPEGVFNVEGGCYAKCIGLTSAAEPEIWGAIGFGSVLENVRYDARGRVDFMDTSLTQNTRCAYPLRAVVNARLPAVASHPRRLLLLTCDATGVLPPVARLTTAQAMYHFVSGYTSKTPGTETDIQEPTAVFSACYGEPFLVHHPAVYGDLLREMCDRHDAACWLVNTGWVGGGFGEPGARRIALRHTRAIVDALNRDALTAPTAPSPVFGLGVPTSVPGVPNEVLDPGRAWADPAAFDQALRKLAVQFQQNFQQYQDRCSQDVIDAGPQL